MLALQKFRSGLLLGTTAVALYFSSLFWRDCKVYFSLKERVPARVIQWKVVEIKDQFAIQALYTFETADKQWEGSYFFPKPYYLNEPSAIAALKRMAKEPHLAWYDPKNPTLSSLQKSFPINLLLKIVVSALVLFYFLLKKFI